MWYWICVSFSMAVSTRPSRAKKGNKSGNKQLTEQPLCKAWCSQLYSETECSNSHRLVLDGRLLLPGPHSLIVLRQGWWVELWWQENAPGNSSRVLLCFSRARSWFVHDTAYFKLAVVPFFINLPASNPITVTHWYIVLYLHIIAVTFTMNANDGTCMRAAAKEQILLVVDHFSILRYKWRQDCAVGSRLYVCFFLDQPFNLCMYRCVDESWCGIPLTDPVVVRWPCRSL